MENMVCKMIVKINLRLAGIIKRLCKSTNRKKVTPTRKLKNLTLYDFTPNYLQVFFCFVFDLILIVDYKAGFGGKYGVQNDRVDKCAVGWEHKEDVTKHESQTGINKV